MFLEITLQCLVFRYFDLIMGYAAIIFKQTLKKGHPPHRSQVAFLGVFLLHNYHPCPAWPPLLEISFWFVSKKTP